MNLSFYVSNRRLTQKGPSAPVADTAGIDTFTIEFDREWEGLSKRVELKNGEVSVVVDYNGKRALPREICGTGALYLTCYGYVRLGENKTAVLQTKPMVHPVKMLGASVPAGSTGQPYTETVYEQISAKVEKAGEIAQKAQQMIGELLAMKDAGAFTGPAGPAATVQVDSVRHGVEAKVENLGTENHARLRFTLPYKLTAGEKQAMAEEFQEQTVGKIDAALDAIAALQAHYIGGEAQA